VRAPLLLLTALLGGCAFARLETAPQLGEAFVVVARLPDGKPAVSVYGINSRHRLFSQPLRDVHSFGVKPGTYILDVDCLRPQAVAVVDGSFDFVLSVDANRRYLLDCAPREKESNNGFFLSDGGT